MKTGKSILTFALVLTLALFTACGGKQDQSEQAENSQTEMPVDHGDHDYSADPDMADNQSDAQSVDLSKEKAEQVLSAYLQIKNALVETNGEAASEAAKKITATLSDNEGELLDSIRFYAEHIAETKSADHQRDHFNTLSDNVYTLVKATDAGESKLYRQYCPMAMNNNGAYWLSAEEEIRNPYFGDKMLKCGSVKETINL